MKPLKPTLKEKKRYLVYEIMGNKNISFEKAKELIVSTMQKLFGVFGTAQLGLNFLEYENNKGVIRVDNKFVDQVKAGFCLINEKNLMIRSVGVSGTLKKIRTKYLGV